MTHTDAVESYASERYLLGEMTEAERQAFEAHYFDCAECADDVRAASRMRDGVAEGLLAAPRTTRTKVPLRAFTYIGWAAAASLALVAAYEGTLLRDRQPIAPQVLSPVTLRAATRGAEAVVPLTEGATALTLALPVEVAASTPLTYEVRAADGRVTASGTAKAPVAGAPLLLLLPASAVAPETHYVLAIHRSADSSLIDQFGFIVSAR